MDVVGEIKRRARKIAGPVLGALVVTYFVYGTVQGDRGLVALYSMTQEMTRAEDALDELRRTRRALERRVALLRSESLDIDLLEERARIVLDYVNPDDIVIFLSPETATDDGDRSETR